MAQSALATTPEGTLGAYSFRIGSRGAADIKARVGSIASVIYDHTALLEQGQVSIAPTTATSWEVISEGRTLSVHYEPTFDTLRVVDVSVADDYGSTEDIGVEAAHEIFHTTLGALRGFGVADKNLSVNDVEVRNRIEGSGTSISAPIERVKEYWFYVPLVIDAARIRKGNQEAGVRIAVNRDGRLASIRVAGPVSVQRTADVPRTVPSNSIEARLAQDFPNAEVRRFGLAYVLDDADLDKPITPRQAYYVGRRTTVQGRTSVDRAQVVSYGLTDVTSGYRVWPVPSPGAEIGDTRH